MKLHRYWMINFVFPDELTLAGRFFLLDSIPAHGLFWRYDNIRKENFDENMVPLFLLFVAIIFRPQRGRVE